MAEQDMQQLCKCGTRRGDHSRRVVWGAIAVTKHSYTAFVGPFQSETDCREHCEREKIRILDVFSREIEGGE